MTVFAHEDSSNLTESSLDLSLFGQRLRHVRRARGLTLAQLGERVGRAPSVLSLIENGRREPKLSLIEALASALSVSVGELLSRPPPPAGWAPPPRCLRCPGPPPASRSSP